MALSTRTRISHTREDLLSLNQGKVKIPRDLFNILQELKICSVKRTHRGCRGGIKRKQRKMEDGSCENGTGVKIADVPGGVSPTLTVEVRNSTESASDMINVENFPISKQKKANR